MCDKCDATSLMVRVYVLEVGWHEYLARELEIPPNGRTAHTHATRISYSLARGFDGVVDILRKSNNMESCSLVGGRTKTHTHTQVSSTLAANSMRHQAIVSGFIRT